MLDDADYQEFLEQSQKPLPPKPYDEQSLVAFLNWLLQPPRYRMFAYPSGQPIPDDKEQFIKSLIRPLPHEYFCNKLAKYRPRDFEGLVADFLRCLGGLVITGPHGADGGVDLRLRTSNKDYIFQCKRRKDKVGLSFVREVHEVAANVQAQGAFIVSVSEFTDDAIYYAKGLSPRVGLIDGKELFNLMTQFTPTLLKRF